MRRVWRLILPGFLPLALIVLVAAASPRTAAAQILDTVSGFSGEPGWEGRAGGFARATGGNTEVRSWGGDLRAAWRGERHRLRAILDIGISESSGVRTSESAAAHLRHNYRLRRGVSTLGFGQIQRNPFQDIRRRSLVGAGLRLDLPGPETRRVGGGVSLMLEREERISGGTFSTTRLSAFVDLNQELSPTADLTLVGFFQPSVDRFSNLRSNVSAQLSVEVLGPLKLFLGGLLEYDSEPAPGVRETDWAARSGLTITL